MNLERAKSENGSFVFDGTAYVLTQQAFLSGTSDEPRYEATAVLESDWDNYSDGDDVETYNVRWDLMPDFDYKTNDDESSACDWDSPVSVKLN